ncbi:Hypothetical protein SMAX5B_015059 [Scophthalmus maximus]|uniref:Uncharacterized protein n=1 Tax=Scophthalmus maximus TaxID=52904 RepID=A0A2U9CFV8_SCOMX|nr:Hypothetical protein SMAX5B_015059 [Scophthalmus maximus]
MSLTRQSEPMVPEYTVVCRAVCITRRERSTVCRKLRSQSGDEFTPAVRRATAEVAEVTQRVRFLVMRSCGGSAVLRDDSQSSGTSGEADGGGRGGNARLPIRIPPRKAAVVCYQNYNEHFHNVASRCTELYRIATHEAAGGDGDVTAESKRIGSIKDMPLQKAFTFPRTDCTQNPKLEHQMPSLL